MLLTRLGLATCGILAGVLLLSHTALVASVSTHNTQTLVDAKDHRHKEFKQIIDSFLAQNSEIKICDDETFLRRIYLDLTATLPEVAEIKSFRESKNPHKREQCIDKLLDNSDFEDYAIMKWCDRLRVKSEFPIRLWPNAVQAYTRYIEHYQRKNLPYDQFVRELLTASGSNFRHAPVNFYRAVSQHNPQGYAAAVAVTFLGQRLEQWPKMEQQNFTHWFEYVGLKSTREWKEEIVYFSANLSVRESTFTFPDGQSIHLPSTTDPREVLAEWLIKTSPRQLQRNAVNRIWYEMLGHGLCARIDDLTPEDLKALHPVLEYLEQFLLDQQWHTREVVALIAKSKLYQQDLSASKSYPLWAQYKVRRLEAEVIVDILQQLLGGSENYSSMIPEPFTFIPTEEKSILLCDGSITSRTLELFGRPPRDTGEIQ